MNSFFRRLPLPVKLAFIGLFPLIFLVYTTFQIYAEKKQKVDLLDGYIDRINQSINISVLIEYLEEERKLSFDRVLNKKDDMALPAQRLHTDSIINTLNAGILTDFTSYTFLDKLKDWRNWTDSGYLRPEQVMHFYTTAIFRINTLNSVSPGGEVYLEPVYAELVGQKLLSDIITNLGIMRSNIYNTLVIKKYMPETLLGMVGVHDVYKTYETEFLLRASPQAVSLFKKMRDSTSLKPTIEYIDTLFKIFKQDSTYTAAQWWQISDEGMDQLMSLRKITWDNASEGMRRLLASERNAIDRAVIFLVAALLFIIIIVVYTILNVTRSLTEMKMAAQMISEGATGLSLKADSKDVIGSLAGSIAKIDATNKLLASTADAIGNGNFNVYVEPRGKEDVLGNAIVRMKVKLKESMQIIQENNKELRLLASRLQEIREEERASIAREVHDVLGQQITILKMDLTSVYKKIPSDDPDLKKKMEQTIGLLDQTLTTVRKIATELRPSILDDFGLVEAIGWQSTEFEKRTGIPVEFQSEVPPDISIPENITIALFRIFQETLTNIARHAGASLIKVRMSLHDNELTLTVVDNGKGFDVTRIGKKKTLGILGMKERTMMIGGKYEISGVPGKGTTVTVVAVLNNQETGNQN